MDCQTERIQRFGNWNLRTFALCLDAMPASFENRLFTLIVAGKALRFKFIVDCG